MSEEHGGHTREANISMNGFKKDDTLDDRPPAQQNSSSHPQQANPTPTIGPPPPNGGSLAWTQCACTFCLWFAAWGLVNSFGVFQTYYETIALPNSTPSNISWIGSLQLCLFIIGTSIIGPMYDLGFLRSLSIAGTSLTVFGMMMTSLCTKYWQFMLAQGVCMGLGMTCLFVPCVAVLPPYFSTRRSLAMGIAASGSSIGAIVFTLLFQQLEPKIGFGWTTRIIGFMLLASLILPMVAMRKRVARSPRRSLIDSTALRELPFIFVLLSMFFLFIGLYIPYFYVQVFSIQRRVLQSNDFHLNKYLIVLMNTGSAVGRLLPNIVADKTGSWNMIVPVSLITGVIGLAWVAVTAKSGLIAFCIFYGFFSGSFVALVPIVWAIVSPNPKLMGTRIAMATVPMAAGLLVGNPIAGALVTRTSFVGLQVFCGCTVIVGAIFLLLGRLAQGRLGESMKV